MSRLIRGIVLWFACGLSWPAIAGQAPALTYIGPIGLSLDFLNLSPLVTLATPDQQRRFETSTGVDLAASALDFDGFVLRIDYYAGDTFIGSVANPQPYRSGGFSAAWHWSGLRAGTYLLTARAVDNRGAVGFSFPVMVTVAAGNRPPSVTLAAPTEGSRFTAPTAVTLIATAADPDGTVSRVEFYQGTTLLGTATGAPYAYTWFGVPAGSYTLTARAIDNLGAAATSAAVGITVTDPPPPPPNTPPTVSLTSPAAEAGFRAPATVDLAANAADVDGGIAKVEFYRGTTLLGTATAAPYAYTWSNVPAGSYTLTARATDNLGAAAVSAAIHITVTDPPPPPPNTPPTVSLTSPAAEAGFRAPATVDLAANAADVDGGIAKVEFYRGTTLLGTATAAPYAYTWSNVPAGSYTLTARATDNLGAAATSAPVNITVTDPSPPPPNTPPTVSLTSPAAGAGFRAPATVDLAANAADADGGIAKVEFYRGTSLIGTATSAPYAYTWSNVPAGSYTLTAKAIDTLGAAAISAAIHITVTDPPANSPPTVSLTSPPAGAGFQAPATVHLAADAADADGTIAKIEFYRDTTLLGTATGAPYAYTWSGAPAGSYTLTAKALDNQGASTTSEPVNIRVNALDLTVTAPADGAALAGDRVTVSGSFQAPPHAGITVNGVAAVPADGEFYAFDVPLGTGTQTLTATLTTLDGQTLSRSITVTAVSAPGVQVRAEPRSGPAPLAVNFTIINTTGSPVQRVEIDSDGDGAFDTTTVGNFDLTYPSPWTYRTGVKVTLADGTVYTRSLPIVVQDPEQMDRMFKSLWNGLNTALLAGDKAAALNYLSPPARAKYGPVFEVLMPDLPQIFMSLSPLRPGAISAEMGEYVINRTRDGIDQVFFIYFLRGADGVWRLDSL